MPSTTNDNSQRQGTQEPPLFNHEREEDVLGCILWAPEWALAEIRRLAPGLVPLHFHDLDLCAAYQAILDIAAHIGPRAVTPDTIEDATGGKVLAAQLRQYQARTGDEGPVAYHAQQVYDLGVKRHYKEIAGGLAQAIYRGDSAAEIAEWLKSRIIDEPAVTFGQFLTVDDLMQEPDPIDLIPGFLPSVGLAMCHAAESNLKSFTVDDIGFHIALGQSWHGRQARGGKVLFVLNEGASGFKKRLRAWEKKHGLSLRGQVFVRAPGKDVPLFDLSNEAHIADLEAQIEAIGGVTAIIFDTLSSALPGVNPNGGDGSMLLAVAHARRLAHGQNLLCLFVHHNNRSGDAKGATDFIYAMDVRFSCTAERNTEQLATGLTVKCEKALRDDAPFPALHFAVEVVNIPTESNLNCSSLVLIPDEKKQAEPEHIAYYKLLLELLYQQGASANSKKWEDDARLYCNIKHADYTNYRAGLLRDGYVTKGEGLRAPYQLTQKGLDLIGKGPTPSNEKQSEQSETVKNGFDCSDPETEQNSRNSSDSLESDCSTDSPTGETIFGASASAKEERQELAEREAATRKAASEYAAQVQAQRVKSPPLPHYEPVETSPVNQAPTNGANALDPDRNEVPIPGFEDDETPTAKHRRIVLEQEVDAARQRKEERAVQAKEYKSTEWFKADAPEPAHLQALTWACWRHPQDVRVWCVPAVLEAFRANTQVGTLEWNGHALNARGFATELHSAYRREQQKQIEAYARQLGINIHVGA